MGEVRLSRDSDLEEVLAYLESEAYATVLFVDGSKFCEQYTAFPWVADEGQIIEVDSEIVDHFQIGKVPQWRFYVKGSEVHHLIGTAPRDEFQENKTKVFGNLRSFK